MFIFFKSIWIIEIIVNIVFIFVLRSFLKYFIFIFKVFNSGKGIMLEFGII